MTENNRFDVLIVGAGQAAIPLAHDLAKAGRRVALVETKHLGGSCVNFGCTPTKAVIASAHVAHLARRGSRVVVYRKTWRILIIQSCLSGLLASRGELITDFA